MEALTVLEQKIAQLIAAIQDLRQKNASLATACDQLADENVQLKAQLEQVQGLLLERPQELALTKLIVDDLIKNIDAIMVKEDQSSGLAS